MGCNQSKIENEEAVSRCKDRKHLMKEAVSHRNAFAAAHSSYAMSLKNTGAALNDYAQGEFPALSSASPSSSASTAAAPPPLPPPVLPPPPPDNMDFQPLQRSTSMPEMKIQKPEMTRPVETIQEEEEMEFEAHDDERLMRKRSSNSNRGSTGSNRGSSVLENHYQKQPQQQQQQDSPWDYFFPPMDSIPGPSLVEPPEMEEEVRINKEQVQRKVYEEKVEPPPMVVEKKMEKAVEVPVPVPVPAPPCLRFTTESHPSSFLKLLCSLTGLTHGKHKSLSFYRRAFFCPGISSGDGGDGGGFVEVEVRSGATETGAEGGAADASYSSAIVPTNPRPEDYLAVYKPLKLALLLVKKEMETSKIQGRFLQGTVFPINKQGKRQFSALSLDESPTPTITNIISNQHWSKLKAHLQNTDPNTLLSQLLNSGADPELTLRYFTWSQKEFKLSHSLELTFRILNSLALAKKYSKIRSFLHKFVKYEKDYSVSAIFHAISMSGDSFCVNSILADMLVLAYVQNLKILRGFEAFKRAGDYGFKLSLISCNPLLSGLVKETENGDVEFVYREMIKRKIEFNVISFNIVVNGLCNVGKLNRAGNVIEDMKVCGVSPNVITYNTLIDGYCKMGRIGKMYKADAILKEMIAKGICPNEITYNILIDGFCKDENVSGAMRVFGEMQRQGLRPNVVTYNTLINGLCSDGKVDEAVALRDQMVSSDLEPNVVTHNVLIKGFCKNKTVKEAINLFNDMEKQGVDPNAMTYNTLIDAYCEDGRMEDAFALYNMMIVRGISPVVSTCNCLIAGLCRKGDVKAARNLMNEMVSMTLSADVVTFNILIDSLCKKGETRKAVKILDEMFEKGLNPSHVTYNTLMDGYCREGNLRAALIVRTRMERKGKQANVVTYNVLIKGFCLKGKLEDANGLLNEMLERGLVPNRTTYEIIKEEMMEKGFVPDIEGHVYNVSDTNVKRR